MNENNSHVQSTNQTYLSTQSPFFLHNASTHYYTSAQNITNSVLNTISSIKNNTSTNFLLLTSSKQNVSNNTLLNRNMYYQYNSKLSSDINIMVERDYSIMTSFASILLVLFMTTAIYFLFIHFAKDKYLLNSQRKIAKYSYIDNEQYY